MNLYHVQDSDRPMYVLAHDWQNALARWKARVAFENDCGPDEMEEPQGIALVCEQDDLILTALAEIKE